VIDKKQITQKNERTNDTMKGFMSEKEHAERIHMIRQALPACQPQEGSPANSFTPTELEQLRLMLNLGPRDTGGTQLLVAEKEQKMDILNPKEWLGPKKTGEESLLKTKKLNIACPQEACFEQPQEEEQQMSTTISDHQHSISPSWYGAPVIKDNTTTQLFRKQVRQGIFQSPTNGQCPGFMQCNLVVLPQGPIAFDFLLFCQRNKKACPLIEVCDVGSPHPIGVARGADLRTDVPKYAIYKNGALYKEVNDATEYWPENSVAFLIGCSFSYDGAFQDAGIPLRSAEKGRNVPMYRTNLPCRSSGSLKGNMVVSMKPISAIDIAKEVEITSKFPHAHGSPVCVGNPKAIGIDDINNPEWGDTIEIGVEEVPVFHACGVTPQSVLMDSKVPFAITHSPGYMFITDLPSDYVI